MSATVTATLNSTQQIAFNLGEIEVISDFNVFFDQYRLCAVKLTFMVNPYLAPDVSTALSNFAPKVNFCIDKDGEVVPPNLSQMRQYTSFRTKVLSVAAGGRTSIYCKGPRIHRVVGLLSGSAVGEIAPPNRWLNLGAGNIEHYWGYYYIEAPSSAVIQVYKKFYFQLKGIR